MKTLLPSRHPQVRELGRRLTRAATSDIPLLLEGETGVGKSWTAARVHRSSRPGRPFVVVDCGALAPGLVASELFGHRAGVKAFRLVMETCDMVVSIPMKGQTSSLNASVAAALLIYELVRQKTEDLPENNPL